MKPFNLEEALAGAPVVTRDGVPIKQLVHFKDVTLTYMTVYGQHKDNVLCWTPLGEYIPFGQRSGIEHEKDLFMADSQTEDEHDKTI